jgi:DNA-binding transcriptional ArsR family regulator
MSSKRASSAELARAAPVFAALGDATRVGIIARLCEAGPLSIVQLTHGTRVSRQAIAKHLYTLEQAGLAYSDRKGRERIWALRVGRFNQARHFLEQISSQWDAALERLRVFVEVEKH